MLDTSYRALTQQYDGKTNVLLSEVELISGENHLTIKAIWDTGATNTCITHEVAQALHLQSIGFGSRGTAGGAITCNRYLVDMLLPNRVVFQGIPVCEVNLDSDGIGALIGMDLITSGDFAITHQQDKTTFTFRIPSRIKLDFVKEDQKADLIGTHGKGNASKRHSKKRK